MIWYIQGAVQATLVSGRVAAVCYHLPSLLVAEGMEVTAGMAAGWLARHSSATCSRTTRDRSNSSYCRGVGRYMYPSHGRPSSSRVRKRQHSRRLCLRRSMSVAARARGIRSRHLGRAAHRHCWYRTTLASSSRSRCSSSRCRRNSSRCMTTMKSHRCLRMKATVAIAAAATVVTLTMKTTDDCGHSSASCTATSTHRHR